MPKRPIKEIYRTFPAEESHLEEIRRYVTSVCRETPLSQKDVNGIQLAVEEACTNVIRHAYRYAPGEIRLKIVIRPTDIAISVVDQGASFDFDKYDTPDLERYIKTGRKGGLGIYLIRKIMNQVEYSSSSEENELRMVKYIEKPRERRARTKGRRLSIRAKFSLFGGLIMLAIVASVYIYYDYRTARSLREKIFQDSHELARTLAANSANLLLGGEDLELANLARGVVEGQSEVAYALIVDDQGRIWAADQLDRVMTEYQPPPGVDPFLFGQPQQYKDTGGEVFYDLAIPISLNNVRHGIVHLGVSDSAILSKTTEARKGLFFIAILSLIVGLGAVYLLSNLFVKPIQRLTKGVFEIGQGDLDSRIPVMSNDEFGEIAQAFNEITLKFKNAQKSMVEQERLQKEMQVAQDIQHTLLPAQFPEIEGYDIATLYQAAREVGGDYFDFVWVDEDTLGIVVADVSGKGVPGSLVMTMIRTALRLEARNNKSASDVLARVNNFVSDDVKKGMFVTIFYIVLDSRKRIINFASAGHNPMILFRGETQNTYFLNPKGIPVGLNLTDDISFEENIGRENIRLKKDDLLVIYTDGITEAMNQKREQFGEERFLCLLKDYGNLHPREFVSKLKEKLLEFTGNAPQNDDITLVAIKEKMVADEVIFQKRKELLDLVEKDGLTVNQACQKMRVSPTTYYRYKKRLIEEGEEGLLDKTLRSADSIRQISLEDKAKILKIIHEHPDYGVSRIEHELSTEKYGFTLIDGRRLYEGLRRWRLNTKRLRLEFIKRSGGKLDERFARELEREREREKEREAEEEISKTPDEIDIKTPEEIEQKEGFEFANRFEKGELGEDDIALYHSILKELKSITDHEQVDKLLSRLSDKLVDRGIEPPSAEEVPNDVRIDEVDWTEELVDWGGDSEEIGWGEEEISQLDLSEDGGKGQEDTKKWSDYEKSLKEKLKNSVSQ